MAEEATAGVHAITKEVAFGDKSRPIMDSGAGRHIANKNDVRGYRLDKSDHPGFRGAGGEEIPVDGKTTVHFRDNATGSNGNADFLIVNVTRPIFSQGAICDKGNITISSSKGVFVIDESIARPVIASLTSHAKITFSRSGPGALYELDGALMEQPKPEQPQPFTRPVTSKK